MIKRKHSRVVQSSEDRQTKIKRLAVVAMFSDDELFERLVLKGGNALDLVHRVSTRASADLDFSMEQSFESDQLENIKTRIEYRLQQAFRPADYEVFDVRLDERPPEVTPDVADFWGGYGLEFRLIDTATYQKLGKNLDAVRRRAVAVGPQARTRFEVQISKFEYCTGKQAVEFDGYTIYVYPPEMLVCEKLRAICQQMPDYVRRMKRNQSTRGRDFLDIHATIKHFGLDLTTMSARELLQNIFAAKRVPLDLLGRINEQREFHRQDWPAVQASVRPGVKLREFDFYFNFVVALCQRLETLWHE